MTPSYDVAVVGSGFAGSLMAMILKRQGRTVVLLEKGSHPRVVIGESSTPLSNLLLEALAVQYDLPSLKPLTKWGTWQSIYPEIGCGLKRGFTFFHHGLGRKSQHSQHLLVAASPNDTVADTHWFRADFDKLLLNEARAVGVDYLDHCEIKDLSKNSAGWTLSGHRYESKIDLRADFIIDATGPRGFLYSLLELEEAALPGYPATSALYGHFQGVVDYESTPGVSQADAPYPPDASALHHVFDGGWMWILRFNNGWTSAGLACTQDTADRLNLADTTRAWERLLHSFPDVAKQFIRARPKVPLIHAPRISFHSAAITGSGWAMLPSAAGFVDPLLSTGFPLTLLGIGRLAIILERHWGSLDLDLKLNQYAERTDSELLATARLIGALYANLHDFEMFRTLSLLYFAAASHTETVRRLNKPVPIGGFLLHDHPTFGQAANAITGKAMKPLEASQRHELQEDIYRLIEQFDVAGLSKRPSNHCYPVRAEDLLAGASKVGATRPEIEALLQRTGFYG